MTIGRAVNSLLGPFGLRLERTPPRRPVPTTPAPAAYDQDGLRSIHNHDFMNDPPFVKAYQRGVAAAGHDYRWHWRVHVGLWAAAHARCLPGDFVECGVNRGFMSSAIMDFLDWDSLGRAYYLLDTFRGLDERYITRADRESGVFEQAQLRAQAGFYTTDAEQVKLNFSQWKNVRIIEGSVPDTLDMIDSHALSFLHLDMNCSKPEVDAAEFLWDRLVAGAVILFDDYAYSGCQSQKSALDEFARSRGVDILSLPTGQGLLIRDGGGAQALNSGFMSQQVGAGVRSQCR